MDGVLLVFNKRFRARDSKDGALLWIKLPPFAMCLPNVQVCLGLAVLVVTLHHCNL